MNTMQHEFDAVVNHLYAQGRPSKEGHSCKYRGPEGTKCAVGCRIPDDVYHEAMEGKVSRTIVTMAELPPEISEYANMFRDLQMAHDNWRPNAFGQYMTDTLDPHMGKIAIKHGLIFTKPGVMQ